jgi:hypothetical protein
MFHGTVAIQYTMDWDRSDIAENCRMLEERLTESFTNFGDIINLTTIKQSLYDHAPASIHYAVVVSIIYEVIDGHARTNA